MVDQLQFSKSTSFHICSCSYARGFCVDNVILSILVLPAFNVTLVPKKAHFSLEDQELNVEVYARSVPCSTILQTVSCRVRFDVFCTHRILGVLCSFSVTLLIITLHSVAQIFV